MTCGCGCPTACGILVPWPGNPCPPHWMVDSQPLDHQEVPSSACFLMVLSRSRVSTVNREPASVGPVCFSLSPNLLAVWSPPEKDTALSGKRGRREPNGQGQSTVHLAGTRQRCGRVCTSLPQAPRPPSRLPELKLPNIFCAFPSVSVFFSPSCTPTAFFAGDSSSHVIYFISSSPPPVVVRLKLLYLRKVTREEIKSSISLRVIT